jgi:hypothetical protein
MASLGCDAGGYGPARRGQHRQAAGDGAASRNSGSHPVSNQTTSTLNLFGLFTCHLLHWELFG